jgi:hypothetical protein
MMHKSTVATDIVAALASLPQPLDLTDAETAYVVWGIVQNTPALLTALAENASSPEGV